MFEANSKLNHVLCLIRNKDKINSKINCVSNQKELSGNNRLVNLKLSELKCSPGLVSDLE